MAENTQNRQLFNRCQVAILVGLVVITLCVYGVVAVSLFGQERTPTRIITEPPKGSKLELQPAREKAQALAWEWQPDAQLVSVVTWWQLTGDDRLTLYRPSWSFSFYSPAADQVQIVTVDQKSARAIRQISVSKAPVPVEADWSLDSDDLLLTFMAYGGEEFMREHPQVNLHFHLSGQDAERPTWYLSAIDPQARQSFMVSVDALSRQVVSTS
jgi:hypothetical protein